MAKHSHKMSREMLCDFIRKTKEGMRLARENRLNQIVTHLVPKKTEQTKKRKEGSESEDPLPIPGQRVLCSEAPVAIRRRVANRKAREEQSYSCNCHEGTGSQSMYGLFQPKVNARL